MRIKKIAWAFLGVHVLGMVPYVVWAEGTTEERILKLEEELLELKEAKQGADHKSPSPSGTTFSYGGYIKVDAMWTDYADGPDPGGTSDLILVPGAIPVDGEAGDVNFDSHIKTSRLFFKTTTDTDVGIIRSHLEFDLLTADGNELVSNSAHSRVRHAYLTWDYSEKSSVLAGQTWSTFFNVGALPESIEFIGPTSGTIFNRQNQIRWTRSFDNGSFMFALENPATLLAGVGEQDVNSTPDIILRLNRKSGRFSWTAASLIREIVADDFSSEYSGSLNLSGKLSFTNGDDIRASFSYGNVGRYVGLGAHQDAVIDGDSLDTIDVTSGYIAYRHLWSNKVRSTIQYAYSEGDVPAGSALNEEISNWNVNLMYSPTPKLTFGGALIHGERKVEGGASGDLDRLQLSAKFVF